MIRPFLLVLAACATIVPQAASGQQRLAGEWAWRPIVTQDSVVVRYIFYSEADNHNNGVVLRLDNQSVRPIRYRFVALFRALEGEEASQEVTGDLDAGATITGDEEGLFFIPFPDGREVAEIGLRGFRVTRLIP